MYFFEYWYFYFDKNSHFATEWTFFQKIHLSFRKYFISNLKEILYPNDNTSFFLKAPNAIPAFYKCYCSGNVHDNVHVHVIVQEMYMTMYMCMLSC